MSHTFMKYVCSDCLGEVEGVYPIHLVGALCFKYKTDEEEEQGQILITAEMLGEVKAFLRKLETSVPF